MSSEDFDARHPHIAALKRKYLPILLANFTGLVLTVAVYIGFHNLERDLSKQEFERKARDLAILIESLKNDYWENIYAADDPKLLSMRQVFDHYAVTTLKKYVALDTIAWLPQVDVDDRSAFDRYLYRIGLENFKIMAYDSEGRVVPAPESGTHFPVLAVRARSDSMYFPGFDVASVPMLQPLMHDASSRHQITASGKIYRNPKQKKGASIAVLLAAGGVDSGTAKPNLTSWSEGLIFGLIDLDVLMQEIFKRFDGRLDVEYVLVDNSAKGDDRLLFASSSIKFRDVETLLTWFQSGTYTKKSLNVGGRHWELMCRPTRHFVKSENHLITRGVIALAIVMTTVFLLYLYELNRHLAGAKAVVRQLEATTRELDQATAELKTCRKELSELKS